jgi:exodeoxyribonuclease-5
MSESLTSVYNQLLGQFRFEPTQEQNELLLHLSSYLQSPHIPSAFVLKGFAGTGKTTLVSTLVKTLPTLGQQVVLLAPTGRAAKVLSQYTQQPAFTIHKFIYHPPKKGQGFGQLKVRPNKGKNVLFIVDEASMISDKSQGTALGGKSLLDDVVSFVKDGYKCKLLFIGDTAQLPPVGSSGSPALEPDYLEKNYDLDVSAFMLTQVIRQAKDSAILTNATQIRGLQEDAPEATPQLDTSPEVIRLVDGYDIEEALSSAYSQGQTEDTTFIVRSNKRANQYNQQIRSRVLWKEDEISTGDYLMVVKNNYFWLSEKSKPGFIANGDILEILELRNRNHLYDLDFVDATVRLVDYPNEPAFETKLLLNSLSVDGPSLPYSENKRLYEEIEQEHQDIPNKWKRYQAISNNPYLNALQVKFGYAVTCHKAQGGQWKNVFIEQSYLPDGVDIEYLRWLYTAFTRATEKVYLIGFSEDYFSEL